MQEELGQFRLHDVWYLVCHPTNTNVIRIKWIFKNKCDKFGNILRNKARLVAQGYSQINGIDDDETFAHVARLEAIRLFLAYAAYMNFKVYQMNVKTTFLHGDKEKEVFLRKPPGFENEYFARPHLHT